MDGEDKNKALNLHVVSYNGINIALRILLFFFCAERVNSYLSTIQLYF